MQCLIILSFIESWDEEYVRSEARGASYVICADGGEDIARACGVIPDCVIGDFDSGTLNKKPGCEYITYPAEKDISDSEACLIHAVSLGYRDITLLGGINGRIDHTLGNISMLIKYVTGEYRVIFRDMKNSVTLIEDSSIKIERDDRYRYFGVISAAGTAKGVTITGAKYPLHDVELANDTTLGISNEIRGDCAEVSVRSGKLLITRS